MGRESRAESRKLQGENNRWTTARPWCSRDRGAEVEMMEYDGLGSGVVLERMLIDERNKIRDNHV